MDRKEFSNMLVEARKEAGKSQFDMIVLLEKQSSTVTSIENAGRNFKVRLAQEYLKSINKYIVLHNLDDAFLLENQKSVVCWINKCSSQIGSRYKLSKVSGCPESMLSNVIAEKANISIDSFLSIANACGYEVKIEKDDTQSQIKMAGSNDLIVMLSGISSLGYCLKIYRSISDIQFIRDKGDLSLFLNKCVKSYGKNKIAEGLNISEKKVSDIISGNNTSVADFQNIVTECGYKIKIEKL